MQESTGGGSEAWGGKKKSSKKSQLSLLGGKARNCQLPFCERSSNSQNLGPAVKNASCKLVMAAERRRVPAVWTVMEEEKPTDSYFYLKVTKSRKKGGGEFVYYLILRTRPLRRLGVPRGEDRAWRETLEVDL